MGNGHGGLTLRAKPANEQRVARVLLIMPYRRTWTTKSGKEKHRWYADVTVSPPHPRAGKRIQKAAPVNTKEGAKQYEREIIVALSRREWFQPRPQELPTLEQFADRFIDDYATVHNKPTEVRSKRSILRCHILPALGSKRINAITNADIARLTSKLTKGRSNKRVNNCLTVLGKMLRTAQDWDIIQAGDVPTIRFLNTQTSDFDFLEFEEAKAFLAAASKVEPENYNFFETALKTGARLGELCALRWDDIDLDRKLVHICRSVNRSGKVTATKNWRNRHVPLTDSLRQTLMASAMTAESDLAFPDRHGRYNNRDKLKRRLWRVCDAAELRRVGFHDLRHTFASHLAMKGVSMKTIQELLGHHSVSVTMKYAHLSPDHKHEAVQVLDW